MIDQAIINRLAAAGSWYFDCHLGDQSDTVVYTGDGVDDLDRLLAKLDGNPKMTMVLDVGFDSSQWEVATRADVVRLRSAFVAKWGSEPKPPVWNDDGASQLVQS